MADIRGRWPGTVVCIASGPSLCAEDVDKVRASGHPTVVTNTTFRMAPWCSAVFGFDAAWWRMYHAEVVATTNAMRFSVSRGLGAMGVESYHGKTWFRPFGNSGAGAIGLAVAAGAKKIVLLGYDCQRTEGKTHWHGDHPKGLGNGQSMRSWPFQFRQCAQYAKDKGVVVLNATRRTALECFDRVDLESALQ